jgi:hypothetical protein
MEDCQGCQQRGWNEDMRSPSLGLLIDPKSDPSVSKVVQQKSLMDWRTTLNKSNTQGILSNIGCQSMWIDTHLMEIKTEVEYSTKDDPISSCILDVLYYEPKT